MKSSQWFCFIAILSIPTLCFTQEWRLFTASDVVGDFYLHDDALWIISGSGLSKVDIHTGTRTTWDIVNSELPDYAFNEITVDLQGRVWLGERYGSVDEVLTMFDGNSWQSFTHINGYALGAIRDLMTTPDGKVWIYGYFEGHSLLYFENDSFYIVPPPDDYWNYFAGTLSTIGNSPDSHVWAIFRDSTYEESILGEYDGQQWILHDLTSFGTARLGPGDHVISDSKGNTYLLIGTISLPNFLKYNGTTWEVINIPANGNDYLNQNRPLFIDKLDRVWVGIQNNTFLRYDGNDWTTIDLSTYGLTDGYADGLFIDANERHWFVYTHEIMNSRRKMLYAYDGTSAQVVDLSNSAIPTNGAGGPFIDPQNNKWFGSLLGLLKFDGNTWIEVGGHANTYASMPSGTNGHGGVWLQSYNSTLPQFDGVTFTEIPIANSDGEPYSFIRELTSKKDGTVYVATGTDEILVYDNGMVTHLDGMQYELFDDYYVADIVYHVELDTEERLYSLGQTLHRLEDSGEWTDIPLWIDHPLSVHGFTIAPNGDIWVPHGIPLPDQGPDFMIYNGLGWSSFAAPFEIMSFPKWDNNGDLWISTENGLCQFSNGNWFCYDVNNSPIPPLRIDRFEIDEHNNFWIDLENGGLLLFNENAIENIEGTDLPVVSGSIYRDLDQNTVQDPSDVPLAFHRVMLLPDSMISFTNYAGVYRFSIPPGDYDIQYIAESNWQIDNSPSSYPVSVMDEDLAGFDFRIKPIEERCDLRLFMHEGFPRCNRLVNYTLLYSNHGTNAESGEVLFLPDPDASVIETSPSPAQISGDTLKWTFTDQLPSARGQIRMNILLPTPTPTDTLLHLESYLDRIANGVSERKDSLITSQELRCAYDPNDKFARTQTTDEDGRSFLDESISYTIRFQNTGNDTAFNVVIRDTLDQSFDLMTLEIIGASHPFETVLRSNGVLEFTFINILLPDSTTNEPASHGFVSYSIRAKEDIPSPTVIRNTAHIYFDYNTGIMTNITVNELIDSTTGIKSISAASSLIHVYPNPAAGEIIIELKDNDVYSCDYTILDMHGVPVLSGSIFSGQSTRHNVSALAPGVYAIVVKRSQTQPVLFIKH